MEIKRNLWKIFFEGFYLKGYVRKVLVCLEFVFYLRIYLVCFYKGYRVYVL